MFRAKSASPLDSIGAYRYPIFETAAEPRLTLITAPPGYMLSDSLAGRITRQNRPLVWLRLDKEDHDPATLLLSIISAVQRQQRQFGVATKEAMREKPGPVYGWGALYATLADEVRENLDPESVLVLENLERLDVVTGTLRLLDSYLLPAIPEKGACIMIASQEMLFPEFTKQAVAWGESDLRLDDQACLSMADCIGAPLPVESILKVEALSGGRPEVLAGVCVACKLLGKRYMVHELDNARSIAELMERTARTLVQQSDAASQQALRVLLQLGYNHPKLIEEALMAHQLEEAPWFQPLDEDWERIRWAWRGPLQRNLEAHQLQDRGVIQSLGERLVALGAISQAVRLYHWAGEHDRIAREVSAQAKDLLDMGQWETLRGWIDQLPRATLESWPELLLRKGEMAAAQGDFEGSKKTFARAAALSKRGGDPKTACESLLAESVVAARMGIHERALVCAMNLVSLATQHGLDDYRGWGLWQIGTLWAILGKPEQAVAYFEHATQWIDDASLGELLDGVKDLAAGQEKAQHLLEFHTQAMQAAQEEEEEKAALLAEVLNAPTPGLESLLKQRGWSGVPAPMSFPIYAPKQQDSEMPLSSIWKRLMPRYRSRMKDVPTGNLDNGMGEKIVQLMTAMDNFLLLQEDEETRSAHVEMPTSTPLQGAAIASGDVLVDRHVESPLSKRGGEEELRLAAYLLGGFRVFINEKPINLWPSSRGRALCKYLLMHRERPVPREILMETFWPSAAFDSARNSLNVAVYDMRQAFREVTESSIVEYEEGAYSFSSKLEIWLDVETFEGYLQASRQYESKKQPELAIRALESAASLYQGDFLADDPYEDWTILRRERMRLAYLDILDHLSQIYFEEGEYSASATLCQLILNRDNCREDAHRRLMRCYSRQGQQHLALRQFYVCSEALRSELDIEPEAATIELNERIRRHESV